MSYVAHQYSRVDFYSSLEVNLSLYYGGVVTHIIVIICRPHTTSRFYLIDFQGYGLFSLRLIGSAMFGATFNLVTRVGLPQFWNTERW